MFGAFITIAALFLGPFSQQVATYPTREVVSDQLASVPAALNYTPALPGNSGSSGLHILGFLHFTNLSQLDLSQYCP